MEEHHFQQLTANMIPKGPAVPPRQRAGAECRGRLTGGEGLQIKQVEEAVVVKGVMESSSRKELLGSCR